MLPMILEYFLLILRNLYILIVSKITTQKQSSLIKSVIFLASDDNTTIYTAATCGTDHFIKIWRIYCLKDVEISESKSRLVPSSAQVCLVSYTYLNYINKRYIIFFSNFLLGTFIRELNNLLFTDNEC